MDREPLRAYLQREFAEVIAEAGIDLNPVLDAVARVFAGIADLAGVWAEPLADYYLLRRARRAFLTMFDVGVEGDTYRLNQLYKNVEAELPKAEVRVAWLVLPHAPDTSGIGEVVTIHSPYLTPAPWGDVAEYRESW